MSVAAPAQRPVPSSTRLIGTLTAAGLCSGLAIVIVHLATLPLIEANKARALRQAVFEVVPDSSSLQGLVELEGQLVPATGSQDVKPAVFAAYGDGGQFEGYAITGAGPGFQEVIKLIYGFDPHTRKITGMYILESRETPGLGDKIFKDAEFVACFDALSVDPTVELNPGKDPRAENQVDAITGATISSKAVVKIINTALGDWLMKLPAPGQEPPAPEESE